MKLFINILLPILVYGDFTLTYMLEENDILTIFYKDAQHIKLTMQNKRENSISSELIINKKHYLILQENNTTEYINLSTLTSPKHQLTSSSPRKPLFKILNTKEHPKVANLDTKEYEVEITQQNETLHTTVILTSNKEFVNALKQLNSVIENFTNQESFFSSFLDIKKDYALVSTSTIKLKNFSTQPLSNALFALPNTKELNRKLP